MYIRTQYVSRTAVIALVLICLFLGITLSVSGGDTTEEGSQVSVAPELFSPERAQTFGYAVSGIVASVDAVTVRAQTASVIHEIPQKEGGRVTSGDVLVVGEVPLLQSRQVLQYAENDLTALTYDALSVQRGGEAEQASVGHMSASSSLAYTGERTDAGREVSASLLAVRLQGSVTALVTALDFIDANKSYFTGKDLMTFRETVDALYGGNRSYLSGSVQYAFHSSDDILAFLEDVTRGVIYPDTGTLVDVAELIDGEMDAVRMVLVSGEEDFLDSRSVPHGGTLYLSYLEQRGSLIESQALLRAQIGSARSGDLDASLGLLDAETSRTLAVIDAEMTSVLAENAFNTKEQSGAVSSARLGVLQAEDALASPRAPFPGIVSEVFVHEGEYVTPGTPLMTLVGSGAKELRVNVPESMLLYLREGAPFTIGTDVVGYVARFAPVLTQGSVEVFIDLVDHEYVAGEAVYGEIVYEIQEDTAHVLPRAYVRFDAGGAYVMTEFGKEIRVTILYDTGKVFVVRSVLPLTEKLIKAVGIAL